MNSAEPQLRHRIKVLKRHAQEAISLLPKVKQRSQILNDVVGALVAALAMIVAVFGLWVGYRLAHYQLDIKFALITVLFYSIKDRIKVLPLLLGLSGTATARTLGPLF
jgi:hypothetical protein